MMLGVTRTLLRHNGPGRIVSPTEVIGRTDPLPTTMNEDIEKLGGQKREMLAGSGVVWFDALESVTHSLSEGGIWSVIVLKELASNYEPC
jgi:hypothetical protein